MSTSAPAVSRRSLTVGMCTAVVAIAFEAIAVATALPTAARELHGLPLYAWAFSILQVGMLLATVATGRLADRIGPAQPMIGGLVLFVVWVGETVVTGGRPYDPGLLRDFATSGSPDLATYAVNDNLGAAMGLLLLVPLLTTALGYAGAASGPRHRPRTPD